MSTFLIRPQYVTPPLGDVVLLDEGPLWPRLLVAGVSFAGVVGVLVAANAIARRRRGRR